MNRSLRTAVAGSALCALATAGLTAAGAAESPQPAPSPGTASASPSVPPEIGTTGDVVEPAEPRSIAWSNCPDPDYDEAGVECGDLTVPLDHADPDGRKITVAVSRLAATGPAESRLGPLLVNFGGPSGTGLDAPLFFKDVLPADVLASYDIIGFDPRGLGASKPNLQCNFDDFPDTFPDFRPSTSLVEAPGENEQAYLSLSERYVAACAGTSADLIEHTTSTEVVADMDAIRAALGAEQLNFYGFSYGTYLGQLYATTYPERTRRFILDGNIDPTEWGYAGLFTRARSFQEATRGFFAWMALHDDVFSLGTDTDAVQASYYALEQSLRGAPLPFVGPTELNDLILFSGFSQTLWPFIAEAFAAAAQGDTSLLEETFTVTEEITDEDLRAWDNANAIYTSVFCGDSTWPASYSRFRSDAFTNDVVAPLAAWPFTFIGLDCRIWPAQKPLAIVDGTKAPELLLTSTAVDPATPLLNSLNVRLQFPNAALLVDTETGSHTATLAGNECIDNQVFDYLRTGLLPERNNALAIDASCPGLPLPEPLDAEDGESQRDMAMMRWMMGRGAAPSTTSPDAAVAAATDDSAARRAAAIAALRAKIIASQRPMSR